MSRKWNLMQARRRKAEREAAKPTHLEYVSYGRGGGGALPGRDGGGPGGWIEPGRGGNSGRGGLIALSLGDPAGVVVCGGTVRR